MDEIDKYKLELANKLASIISKEGLTDVTDWIEKNARPDANHNGVARSVAYILEATGEFQREELLDKTRYYVKGLPPKAFRDKHPTIHELLLIIAGAIIGLAASYFQNQWQDKQLEEKLNATTLQVQALSDSLTSIRLELDIISETTSKKNDTVAVRLSK
jgi:hypothetical protein